MCMRRDSKFYGVAYFWYCCLLFPEKEKDYNDNLRVQRKSIMAIGNSNTFKLLYCTQSPSFQHYFDFQFYRLTIDLYVTT